MKRCTLCNKFVNEPEHMQEFPTHTLVDVAHKPRGSRLDKKAWHQRSYNQGKRDTYREMEESHPGKTFAATPRVTVPGIKRIRKQLNIFGEKPQVTVKDTREETPTRLVQRGNRVIERPAKEEKAPKKKWGLW